MSVRWLKELDKEHPSLAETARRLNTQDDFVMLTKEGSRRRRSSANRDSEGSDDKSKRNKKHGKMKGGGSDGSGEDGGESGSESSSFKRGQKYGSDGSREGSLSPPPHDD